MERRVVKDRRATVVRRTALLALLTTFVAILVTGSALADTPVFTGVPADIVTPATGPSGAVVTYTNPTATDAVDGDLSVTCVPVSGSTFPIATTTVTCTAIDTLEYSEQASFTVTVVDTTPPVFTGVPAAIVATATGPSGAVVTYTNPTATDVVDGNRPVTCVPASGSTFPIATTTVTCTATDTHGNSAHASFTVTVGDTGSPPPSSPPSSSASSVIVPASFTVEATSSRGAVVTYSVSSGDNPPLPITCSPASGSTFPLGTTTVICNATNPVTSETATNSFTITVKDTSRPVFAQTPADIVKKVKVAQKATVTYSRPIATDRVDGAITSVCNPPSGFKFKFGTTSVKCKATDAHDNSSTVSFQVRVVSTGLLSPTMGASLTAPPWLAWKATPKATYYNVQLFTEGAEDTQHLAIREPHSAEAELGFRR
jgi:hypothetical protein